MPRLARKRVYRKRPIVRRRTTYRKKPSYRRKSRVTRFGTKGSIKAHHFHDRIIGCSVYYGTTSLSVSTYQMVWSASASFSTTLAPALTPTTGQVFQWFPKYAVITLYTELY